MACDLVVTSVTPHAPTTAGGTGSVEIHFTTSSDFVFFDLSGPATQNPGLVYAKDGVTYGPNLPPGGPYTYTLRQQNDDTCVVTGSFTVPDFVPVPGCTDEYADNFDPAATVSNNSCTYSMLWRSAWQPMAVRVAAQAGQTAAFIEAKLRVGFRPGHPLAADRPLGDPIALRATVGPDGYATFNLGQHVRPQLGVADGAGGYRLDLNSPTAFTNDLYVGYELRRSDNTLLEHGYALNAAVPDAQLINLLTPFPKAVPIWPGFDTYTLAYRNTGGRYGLLATVQAYNSDRVSLPCPPNPLPVAWLAPGGGYGYWVFQGRPQLGDEVSEGQQYREPASGQRRYSDPGEAYQTVKTSSGVFKGDALLTGLRTLWRSPQAWVQLGGVWVPIVIPRETREVGRLGVLKNEVSLSFQLAMPEWAQGQ